MAIFPAVAEPAAKPAIAILARAPQAGVAKTRLIPALGKTAAARLQRRLTLHALAVARLSDLGNVTLWGAPDEKQRFFRALRLDHGVDVRSQPAGDLGARMAAVFAAHAGPLLLIGSDCPALSPSDLVTAASVLLDARGNDAVFIPAEDGGYVLIGLRRLEARVFEAIDWGSDKVMAQTRERLSELRWRWIELPVLWDVDRPEDLPRLATLQGVETCPR